MGHRVHDFSKIYLTPLGAEGVLWKIAQAIFCLELSKSGGWHTSNGWPGTMTYRVHDLFKMYLTPLGAGGVLLKIA